MNAIEEQVVDDVLDSGRAGGMAIRGGALRLLAYGGAMLASLISVPFMTRHVGEVDYGYYITVSSILFILGGLTEAGLTNLGTRHYALRSGAEREAFLRDLVGLRLTLTVTGIALAVAFTAVTGQPGPVVAGTAIYGLGMLLTLTQQTYAVSLSAQLRLGWVSALELIKHATISATILVLVAAGASIVPFFAASVVGGAVVLAVTLLVLREHAALLPAFNVAAWRSMMREVLPYALAAAVGLIYFRLAVVLMSYVASDAETGVYSAAFRAIEAVGVIPWLLVGSAFPILARAARDDAERLRYGLARLFDVALLTGTGLGLALFVGAPFVIHVIAGAQFEASIPVLRILALSLITTFLFATSVFALLSLERYRDMLIANAIAALTAAVLTVVLAPPFGAKGAAYATLAAEATLVVAYFVALGRQDRVLLPNPRALLRIAPAAAAFLAVDLAFDWHPVIEVMVGGALYLGLAFATRAVPGELVAALLRRDPGSAT